MTLDATQICFPNNVVELLSGPSILASIDPGSAPGTSDNPDGLRIVKRPVRTTDSTETIGITPLSYAPQDDSYETQGSDFGPTLQNYSIAIQCMVIDADEERAIATHSLLSHLVRHKLYHDPALAVSLPLLSVSLNGTIEKFSKKSLGAMNFMNDDLGSIFLYMSTVELSIVTEISKV